MSSNVYLEANFAPVTEELTVTDLEVSGSIPKHLNGRYLRNGPNPITAPDNPAAYHWFLGTGMVHGIRIREGRAEWYRNRWVRNGDVTDALGEPRRPGPTHGGFDFAPNTNVISHNKRTFALVEAGSLPYELTDTLDTIGSCDFDGTLNGGYSPHPHRDSATGELHTVSYYFGWGNKVQYTVLDREAHIRRSVDIEVAGSPMMHDFALTESHIVILDLPVVFDIDIIAAGGSFPYAWNPDYAPRVGVMKRESDGSDIQWFEVGSCYVFHVLNAYDDGGSLVIDVVRHPKMFDTDRQGPNEGDPTLDRWTLDLVSGHLTESRLDDRSQEFPRIDERLTGLRHRYGYAVSPGLDTQGLGGGSVLKHDMTSGSTIEHALGATSTPGEFVFVASGPDVDEDDGVVMGLVHDASSDLSSLEILDASTLEPVASVRLPTRVPEGFHGNWIAD